MQSCIIGSSAACDVVMTDPYVSMLHARAFKASDGRVWIEDVGSINGTWVNEHRIVRRTELRVGDVLRIGQTAVAMPLHAFVRWD